MERRERGESLTPAHVLDYLVGKRLFRIGFDLSRPRCQLRSWFPVDDLRQLVNCQMWVKRSMRPNSSLVVNGPTVAPASWAQNAMPKALCRSF